MKYVLEIERDEEGWEVNLIDEDGLPSGGIFGCSQGETKDFAFEQVKEVFSLLEQLTFTGPCEG